MEGKTVRIAGSTAILLLVVVLVVLRICLGASKAFFLAAAPLWAVQIALLVWILSHQCADRHRHALAAELAAEGEQIRLEYSFLRRVAGLPTRFRLADIEVATNSFQTILGCGSSGAVFKGVLHDGTEVAVKRIDVSEHGASEFKAEVAAIASVQHVNLVRLLGFCAEGSYRHLVYEYVHNGSLDAWIFPEKERHATSKRHEPLPWHMRFRVAIDVARALSYLHHDCRSRILHLDVKPENILLDDCYRALVSDFGLSRLMGRDESRVVTTVRGTRGYLAPEWLLEHGITEKSDIYSYGMVLLELVGGRRNVRVSGGGRGPMRKWSYFPKVVMEKVKEERVMDILDPRLACLGVEEREVRLVVFVALWCIQEKPRLRPSMARVVDMLEGRVHVDTPPETKMAIVDLLSIDEITTPDRRPMSGAMASDAESIVSCSMTMSVASPR
ncbi:hypothetical protein AMTRI_Chr05g62090 [Amborella trichopoda]|uniref:Protein kinase domain-containing protein n=1 Tax=Amborella trichopoda TaxID=13333 RepID=W1P7D8_AMBTC|nr:probable receptor-like protein kinase At5g20050 [Amborella trichopoda]ERN03594.1 hypothetical protein AMTR_s00042p00157900 [Amborella trichopoda]|eukprot:XP_006841919.1 probable receptor-like protein kinase At5g20050 [Amborella trichopoda]